MYKISDEVHKFIFNIFFFLQRFFKFPIKKIPQVADIQIFVIFEKFLFNKNYFLINFVFR